MKESIHYKGVFPRWVVKTNISRTVHYDEYKTIRDPESQAFKDEDLKLSDMKKKELRSI
jgi:hypothetical protein